MSYRQTSRLILHLMHYNNLDKSTYLTHESQCCSSSMSGIYGKQGLYKANSRSREVLKCFSNTTPILSMRLHY
uniref:Uncharacterized protein n=1 Tax=Rhizophora mucronata TaxID=61149 RepID=A0A2P2JVI4_RHIMU